MGEPAASSRSRISDGAFVSESTLEAGVRAEELTRPSMSVCIVDGRLFVLTDAVRILGRRDSDTDPFGLLGRVETLRSLLRRGITLAPQGIRIGHATYDVEFGFLCSEFTV